MTNETNNNWLNMALAPTGGFVGAVIGGVLWAKYIQWTGLTAGWIAIAIGLLTGFGVFWMSKTRKISISTVAALFAILGILCGKYLDVRWNAPKDITVGVIDSHEGIPPDYAESVAKMFEASDAGGSTWKMMRRRMEWFDLVYYAVAGFIAFRVSHSKRLHRRFFKME